MRFFLFLTFLFLFTTQIFAEQPYNVIVNVSCKDESEKVLAEASLERALRKLGDVNVKYTLTSMKEAIFFVSIVIIKTARNKSISYQFA